MENNAEFILPIHPVAKLIIDTAVFNVAEMGNTCSNCIKGG